MRTQNLILFWRLFPWICIQLGMDTDFKLEQPAKAPKPIEKTESGMLIDLRLWQLAKA